MEISASNTCTLRSVEENAVLVPDVRITVVLPDGGEAGTLLGMNALVLGQSRECDLVIADPLVSRRHCELRLTQRGVVLRDLGSKNGTRIDHVSVVEAILEPGATAKIGNTRFSALAGGASRRVLLSLRHQDADPYTPTRRVLSAGLVL